MKRLITKKDILIIALALCLGIVGIILTASGDEGAVATVYLSGEPIAEIQITDEYYEAEYNGVTVCCQQGEIYVRESTCTDKICIRTDSISKAGECIVCAPNRIAIEIDGKSDSSLDAMTG